jgi:hypothetical protein
MMPFSTLPLTSTESAIGSANRTCTGDSEDMIPLVKAEIMGLNSGVSGRLLPGRLHANTVNNAAMIVYERRREKFMVNDLGI